MSASVISWYSSRTRTRGDSTCVVSSLMSGVKRYSGDDTVIVFKRGSNSRPKFGSTVCRAATTAVQKSDGELSYESRVSQATEAVLSVMTLAAHVLTKVVFPNPAGATTTPRGRCKASFNCLSSRGRNTRVVVGCGM